VQTGWRQDEGKRRSRFVEKKRGGGSLGGKLKEMPSVMGDLDRLMMPDWRLGSGL